MSCACRCAKHGFRPVNIPPEAASQKDSLRAHSFSSRTPYTDLPGLDTRTEGALHMKNFPARERDGCAMQKQAWLTIALDRRRPDGRRNEEKVSMPLRARATSCLLAATPVILGSVFGGCAQYAVLEPPVRAAMQTNGCRTDEVLLCTSRGQRCRPADHRCASLWIVQAEIDRIGR